MRVCKKISKAIGVIYRSRFTLSSTTKLSLYYTLIYPYLTYCNSVWSSTYVSNLRRVLMLQKRVVRLLTNSGFREHTAPLFRELNLLNIYKINSTCFPITTSYYHLLSSNYLHLVTKFIIIILELLIYTELMPVELI